RIGPRHLPPALEGPQLHVRDLSLIALLQLREDRLRGPDRGRGQAGRDLVPHGGEWVGPGPPPARSLLPFRPPIPARGVRAASTCLLTVQILTIRHGTRRALEGDRCHLRRLLRVDRATGHEEDRMPPERI